MPTPDSYVTVPIEEFEFLDAIHKTYLSHLTPRFVLDASVSPAPKKKGMIRLLRPGQRVGFKRGELRLLRFLYRNRDQLLDLEKGDNGKPLSINSADLGENFAPLIERIKVFFSKKSPAALALAERYTPLLSELPIDVYMPNKSSIVGSIRGMTLTEKRLLTTGSVFRFWRVSEAGGAACPRCDGQERVIPGADIGRSCLRNSLHTLLQRARHNYSTDPLAIWNGFRSTSEDVTSPLTPLYLGVELESGLSDTNPSSYKEFQIMLARLGDKGLIAHDSSTGELGFELKTVPGTLSWHTTNMGDVLASWASLQVDRRHGMHVHMDRSSLSDVAVAKMLYLVNHHVRFFRDWLGSGRTDNRYCFFSTFSYSTSLSSICSNSPVTDHHAVLSITRAQTVELRVFPSPSTWENYLQNIEFCDALWRFVRYRDVGRQQLTPVGLLAFMREHAARYQNIIGVMEPLTETS